ncbi:MAG: 2-phosphosulfolactate phosphatase [Bacteroidota bacterium]|jgi:2-phosphosulfolactate phosphatase
MKRTIDVCFSPALLPLYDYKGSIVVVIDVLRATSSICVAFANGVRSIVPVATLEESMAYREKGYLVGAERKGERVDGFDLGNSPFSFMDASIKNRDIALTTTNGTQAIKAADGAHSIVVGSFLNLDALCQWLLSENQNVVLLCSGWKNSFNLEDTLFAGAVVDKLKGLFDYTDHRDSAIAAQCLYDLAKTDLLGFLEQSSHRHRLAALQIEKDVEFCLIPNQTDVVPVLKGSALVNVK